ncbi:MAG: hypothetical protein GY830_04480 [Bacteroidetes bacterium]|nr:hypothetical protein [Bacteroidota bacterium]
MFKLKNIEKTVILNLLFMTTLFINCDKGNNNDNSQGSTSTETTKVSSEKELDDFVKYLDDKNNYFSKKDDIKILNKGKEFLKLYNTRNYDPNKFYKNKKEIDEKYQKIAFEDFEVSGIKINDLDSNQIKEIYKKLYLPIIEKHVNEIYRYKTLYNNYIYKRFKDKNPKIIKSPNELFKNSKKDLVNQFMNDVEKQLEKQIKTNK